MTEVKHYWPEEIVGTGEQYMAQANARHIVVCVNACEGASTEVLERGAVHDWGLLMTEMEKQRDALLAALESMMRDTGLVSLMRPDQVERNTAAIAATKGGAKTLEDLQQLSSERQMSPECFARIIDASKAKGGAA